MDMMKLKRTTLLLPILIAAAISGCRDLDSEYFIPAGHPADPGTVPASAIGIPPLEPTSEDVRPKISWNVPGTSSIGGAA